MAHTTLVTVDDEAHIHAGLDAIMDWHALGYEHVASALNGQEGLAIVDRFRPDVVVTDIKMPGMDGLEMVARIRRMDEYDPVIIIVSGYDDFEYARAALRYQVRDYLLKPIDETDLADHLTRIREMLERESDAAPSASPESSPSDLAAAAVRRILSGDTDARLLRLAADALGHESDTPYAVAYVVPAEPDPASIAVPLEIDRLREKLAGTKASESAEWLVRAARVAIATVVRPEEDASEGTLALWVKGLHRTLSERLERPITVIAGPLVRGGAHLDRAHRELVARLRARHLVRSGGPLVVEDEESLPWRGSDPIGDAVATVVESVENVDVEAAAAAIDSLFARFEREPPPVDRVEDALSRLRLEIDDLVRALDGTPAERASRDALRFVATSAAFVPLDTIRNAAVGFARDAAGDVAELRRFNRTGVVTLMRRRADRRYAEELSIAALAGDYGMNAVYLGQLFRKVVGCGFRDYVQARRLREAKRLLVDTDLHIPEIAAMVGYRDVDFFTELFRNENGLTPTLYRQSGRES